MEHFYSTLGGKTRGGEGGGKKIFRGILRIKLQIVVLCEIQLKRIVQRYRMIGQLTSDLFFTDRNSTIEKLSCHAIICFTHSRFFFRDLELTADQTLKIFKIVSEFEKFRVFKKNFAIFERRRIFIKIILVFRVLELIRNGILEILRLFWEFRKCRNSKFDWCWILKI